VARKDRIAPRVSFEVRLFLLLLSVAAALLLIVGVYVSFKMEESLYEQTGMRAEVQARQIAAMPELVHAVQTRDLRAIELIVKGMKQRTDADYIVIGDRNARHLYHPDPHVAVGTPMQGGDNEEVLLGHSSVTLRTGSMGVALRGKAPINDADGKVIGIVTIGYMQKEIFKRHVAQRVPVVVFLVLMLSALFWSAWLFAKSVKRQMLNLEPIDISRLVRQQEAVFESIMEGVVAVDIRHRVTAINRAAREILGDTRSNAQIVGADFDEMIGSPAFFSGENATREIKDEIVLFRNVQVIANRVPITIDDVLQGWVISFRRRDDINTLSLQLSQIRRYADNLRVVRHEHLNWISTLSGLLQMRCYDEALRLAQMQSETQQRVLDYLSGTFHDPKICGLLIGKYYRARELGLELEFDPGCSLDRLPPVLAEPEWMSIIGNLLDNAFDAALAAGAQGNTVTLYLAESEDEVIIEVADNGCGIDEAIRGRIFERGVSSKAAGEGERGIGLYLVQTYVKQAGGAITVGDNEPCGTILSVFVPKGVAVANA
jgi:two-component system cit operon sensor histidine kinase CitA